MPKMKPFRELKLKVTRRKYKNFSMMAIRYYSGNIIIYLPACLPEIIYSLLEYNYLFEDWLNWILVHEFTHGLEIYHKNDRLGWGWI